MGRPSGVRGTSPALGRRRSQGDDVLPKPEFTSEDFATLKDYCHDLDVDFASFGVLTPLPGADLMDEVGDRLITDDYDFFDFAYRDYDRRRTSPRLASSTG
jgi:hypothetical protein